VYATEEEEEADDKMLKPIAESLNDDIFLVDAKLNKKLSLFWSKVINKDEIISVKYSFFNKIKNGQKNSSLYNHENFNEVSRWSKRAHGTVNPCRIIKYPLVSNEFTLENVSGNVELLRFRFNDDQSKLTTKPFSHNTHLVMKQKRYKPLKLVPARVRAYRELLTGKKGSVVRYSGKMLLANNSYFTETEDDRTLQYKFIKKFKKQSENVPLALWKRLLRTKRTLVLPAHINITVVTNSYDVVHSWFIPGLGLKMDCVPGRATHHVLNIDNVGFYYGQCAEICGRYHHHMPIRVCALPFEHFLVWWHSYGLNKLLFVGTDEKKFTKAYALRKYVW